MTITVSIDALKVDFENEPGGVTLIGVDVYDLLQEIGSTEEILDMLEYSDVVEYVARVEKEKMEDDGLY